VSNRDALGAQVRVTAGGKTQLWHVTTSVGYLCSSQKTIHVGLGAEPTAEMVEVRWPTGRKQVLRHVRGDRAIEVVEE